MRTKNNGFNDPMYVRSYVYPTHLIYNIVILNKYIVTLEHCNYLHVPCRKPWPLSTSVFRRVHTKCRKATVKFRHVRPSAWNNSASTGRIFTKFGIYSISRKKKSVEKIQVSLKSDKNNGYVTWRPMYIFDNTSLNSYKNDKCFRQKF
jgi:hypothetical protein